MKEWIQRLKTVSTLILGAIAIDGYRRTLLNDNATADYKVLTSFFLGTEKRIKCESTLRELESNKNELDILDVVDFTANVDESLTNIALIKEAKAVTFNILSKPSNEFVGGEYINSIFSPGELSTAQLGALGHILLAIGIYYCVISIATIYYGDLLIKYFNLEIKYPRLAKLIQYRRKFQYYNMSLNIILILFAAGYIIFANISVFKYL